MGKRLLITSTDLMMIQFLGPHVINLSQNGFDIDLACSNVGGRIDEVKDKLANYTKEIHVVDLKRSPVSPINFKGYKEMKKLINSTHYDIIWTNEPVMGVVTRLAAKTARKKGTKVLYMVHGFHFFKGAPVLNWILYYPIERFMASKADMICTVNQEDYRRAQTFNVNQVRYIHGIGIDTNRLTSENNTTDIRMELGLKENDFIVISVGELNKNKNQKTIIKALSLLQDPNIHYVLCGKGDELSRLERLVSSCGLENNVHFLGYRKDVVDICSQSDLYVMPSKREGLGLAALEALYCGLPLVTSNVGGLVDIVDNEKSGYLLSPNDIHGFAKAISYMKNHIEIRQMITDYNKRKVTVFCLKSVKEEVLTIIKSFFTME